MTKVYFVRHAKPDFTVHDDFTRPLTEEGLNDSKKVTNFLLDKRITKIFSSPYKRAVDTVKDLADQLNLPIRLIDEFRERKIADKWIEDFHSFAKQQWSNFDYKLDSGESLSDVQKRNILALKEVLMDCKDETIVIGTLGTALSTMINYYQNNFLYEHFNRIKDLMPFIVCFTFNGDTLELIEEFTL
jgi:2,3-bisphosphoglycerate-dependent phosphoglycerate mutase